MSAAQFLDPERELVFGIGFQVVDADELVPVEELGAHPVLLAVAAFFGVVRLIDNIVLHRTCKS